MTTCGVRTLRLEKGPICEARRVPRSSTHLDKFQTACSLIARHRPSLSQFSTSDATCDLSLTFFSSCTPFSSEPQDHERNTDDYLDLLPHLRRVSRELTRAYEAHTVTWLAHQGKTGERSLAEWSMGIPRSAFTRNRVMITGIVV
jgi:hypothetical protein